MKLISLHLRWRCALEEFSDLITELLGQVYITHGCVSSIDLALHLLAFDSDLRDQDGELTEDISLENGTSQVDHDAEYEFTELFRAQFVATDDQDGVIEAYPV